jgi:hypothetical protein
MESNCAQYVSWPWRLPGKPAVVAFLFVVLVEDYRVKLLRGEAIGCEDAQRKRRDIHDVHD